MDFNPFLSAALKAEQNTAKTYTEKAHKTLSAQVAIKKVKQTSRMSDSEYTSDSEPFSHGDNLISEYSLKEINDLLNRYRQSGTPKFSKKTLEEQKEQLLIEQDEYTKKDKYKIIMYLTKNYKQELLLYIKEELGWDFDFYFYGFPYATATIAYCKSLDHLKFYFEVLKLDYDYTIYDLEYCEQTKRILPPNRDLLYTATINLLRYDFSMFEYVFNKVVENNPLSAIKGNSKMLYNIINCNNPEFICNIIDKYELDIYYINPVIRVSVLFFAVQRCTLDTILYLNDKYECDVFKEVSIDGHLQKFIIKYLFTYCNYGGIQQYLFPESERERIFEYVLDYVGYGTIYYAKRILRDGKLYINYDVYMKLIDKYDIRFELSRISNTCSSCLKEVEKVDGTICYTDLNDSIIHNECIDEQSLHLYTGQVYINSCPICLDDDVNEYIVFDCGHMICINCITEYKKHSSTCSYCRAEMDQVGYIKF